MRAEQCQDSKNLLQNQQINEEKDAYLHGKSTTCINPMWHELIQFIENISSIYDFKIYTVEHRLPLNK